MQIVVNEEWIVYRLNTTSNTTILNAVSNAICRVSVRFWNKQKSVRKGVKKSPQVGAVCKRWSGVIGQ